MKKSEDVQAKVHLILGARPNQMKVAPIYKALIKDSRIQPFLIDTGQHFDQNMSEIFRNDFQLPTPHASLQIGSGSHATQTGKIMTAYEKLCMRERPDWTIVFGDVNSTLACSLVAAKMSIPVIHAEAGLRSRDRTMPEEINRIVTDSISTIFWTPSQDASDNLIQEGQSKSNISLIGNLMIDSLVQMLPKIRISRKYQSLNLKVQDYCVATFHRPSNVDNYATLKSLVNQLIALSKEITVVFPLHPRTLKALQMHNLYEALKINPSILLMEPLGYVDFLNLVINSSFVLTDSGGIQEETAFLGIPCFTVRENTERPITFKYGFNELTKIDSIQDTFQRQKTIIRAPKTIPYWDGEAAGRAVKHLLERIGER